jgi:hypothetical protein
MWQLAAIELAEVIPLIIGILGVTGLIFTALRYRRDDTTAVLSQQDTIMNEMKTINSELRTTATDLRTERDGLKVQVEELTRQVAKLRGEEPHDK